MMLASVGERYLKRLLDNGQIKRCGLGSVLQTLCVYQRDLAL